jgi:hypothetical protein
MTQSPGRRALEHLCRTIGPRWAGSDTEHRAGEYLADELAALGLAVRKTRVRYVGWEPLGESTLTMMAPHRLTVSCVPFYYAAPTSTPVQGKVVPAGRAVMTLNEGSDAEVPGPPKPAGGSQKYAIIDGTGEEQAWVVLGGLEKPRPGGFTQYAMPAVLASSSAGPSLAECRDGTKEVRASLELPARFVPDAWSYNVFGELPGAGDRFLVIGAHYDSLWNTGGAFDNGSGVMALLDTAAELVRSPPGCPVRFCLYGAEELDFQGSRHHVLTLKERGELPNVLAMINLDAVGNPGSVRQRFHNFRVTHSYLGAAVEAALAEFHVAERYGWEEVLSPFPWRRAWISRGSDYCFFAQEGVPAISCGANGAVYGHCPEDTIENMDPQVVEFKAAMTAWIARRLAEG